MPPIQDQPWSQRGGGLDPQVIVPFLTTHFQVELPLPERPWFWFTSFQNTQDQYEIDALEALPYVDRIIAAAQ